MTPKQRRRRRRDKARREKSRITAEAARESLHRQGELAQEALAAMQADIEVAQAAGDGDAAQPAPQEPAGAPQPAQGGGKRRKTAIDAGRRWHVVVAKPRFARRAVKDLAKAGIPAVLTDERVELVEENGRRRIVQRQLLRRVLFVGLTAAATIEDVHDRTFFVRDAVRDGQGRAIHVPPAELQNFVDGLADTLTERDPNAYEEGDEVRIKSGPFASFTGIVEEADFASRRLKVAVQIFGRASPVGLDFAEVERA
jgi:transcriptional antiterminator NusG